MKKYVGVKVTWVTMNHPSMPYARKEVDYFDLVPFDSDASDLDVCEAIYRATNLYEGEYFDRLSIYASKDRGHTAISVGDFVEVDGNSYVCEDFGWRVVSKVDA
jgi:hypothetical protein